MSAADKADQLFWLAYCDLIKKKIGTKFGSSTAIFFCTQTQRGPPVGDAIDAAYTNTGLYSIGDNLLQPDNLFYVPSTQNSYIKSLLTYLDNVDLGGRPDDATLLQVKNTAEDMESARTKMMSELKKALTDYGAMKEAGMIGDQTFAQWSGGNAAAYVAARTQYQTAAAANQMAVQQAYGPVAQQYNLDRSNIWDSMTLPTLKPGFNMPCTTLTPANAREILNAFNQGTTIPAPGVVFYQPEYRCPNYASTVKSWQNLATTTTEPKKFKLTVHDSRNVQENDFGQIKAGAGYSFNYVPWVSFGTSGSTVHTETSLKTEDEAQNIEITVFYDDMKAVTINPGSWNIGDPKNTYKLRAGAPDRAKMLVVPSQMILVSKLGYKVKFGARLASQFDKKVTDVKTGGGYVRIFGIPIKVGGDASRSTETTTHFGTWDDASNEFTVQPTADGGFANVIAILGEKISTI